MWLCFRVRTQTRSCAHTFTRASQVAFLSYEAGPPPLHMWPLLLCVSLAGIAGVVFGVRVVFPRVSERANMIFVLTALSIAAATLMSGGDFVGACVALGYMAAGVMLLYAGFYVRALVRLRAAPIPRLQ